MRRSQNSQKNQKRKYRTNKKSLIRGGGLFSSGTNPKNKIKAVIKETNKLVMNYKYQTKTDTNNKILTLTEHIKKLDSSNITKCLDTINNNIHKNQKEIDSWKNKNKWNKFINDIEIKQIVTLASEQKNKYGKRYTDHSYSIESLAQSIASGFRRNTTSTTTSNTTSKKRSWW